MLSISETGIEISQRFFLAIETLKHQKRIRGLQTFTRKHGLNYGNMNTLKNHITTRSLKPEYLAFICEDYGISCEWLLLGKGDMFIQISSKNEESQPL